MSLSFFIGAGIVRQLLPPEGQVVEAELTKTLGVQMEQVGFCSAGCLHGSVSTWVPSYLCTRNRIYFPVVGVIYPPQNLCCSASTFQKMCPLIDKFVAGRYSRKSHLSFVSKSVC